MALPGTETGRRVTVRVVLSVEVDVAQWEVVYGDAFEELRDEVRGYVAQHVRYSAAAEDGAIVGVRVR